MDITSILQMHQELSLTAVFLLMFVLDLFLPVRLRHWLRPSACALLGIELLANIWPDEVILFGGMYHSTPMASIMKSVLTLGTILVFLQSTHWLRRPDTRHKMGEFYTLTLSTLLGMYFMVSAGHFLLFFLGLELATVPMACLRQIQRSQCRSRSKIHFIRPLLQRYIPLWHLNDLRNRRYALFRGHPCRHHRKPASNTGIGIFLLRYGL